MINEIFNRQQNAQLIGEIIRCKSDKFEQKNSLLLQILVFLVVNVVSADIRGFKLIIS